MFIRKTPREYIEGYTDAVLEKIAATPVEQGGSPMSNPIMSINGLGKEDPTNVVRFFVGDDDYAFTKNYGKYYDSSIIALPSYEVKGLRTFEPCHINPWKEPVPVLIFSSLTSLLVRLTELMAVWLNRSWKSISLRGPS